MIQEIVRPTEALRPHDPAGQRASRTPSAVRRAMALRYRSSTRASLAEGHLAVPGTAVPQGGSLGEAATARHRGAHSDPFGAALVGTWAVLQVAALFLLGTVVHEDLHPAHRAAALTRTADDGPPSG
jgi:hypothetical protein